MRTNITNNVFRLQVPNTGTGENNYLMNKNKGIKET